MDARGTPEAGASLAARPFNPWLWAGATVPGLGLALLVWQGVMAAMAIPLQRVGGGHDGTQGPSVVLLLLGSLPGGMLAGLLVGFLQGRVLRPSLPGLSLGTWLRMSAVGHGIGLTGLAFLSQSSDGSVERMMGPAVWGLSVGMMQAAPLVQARVLRGPFWMLGCFVGFALDGPVSAVGRALRSQAALAGRMEWMGALSWAPWLVSLVGVGVVTGFALRWVLAGPRILTGAGAGGGPSAE